MLRSAQGHLYGKRRRPQRAPAASAHAPPQQLCVPPTSVLAFYAGPPQLAKNTRHKTKKGGVAPAEGAKKGDLGRSSAAAAAWPVGGGSRGAVRRRKRRVAGRGGLRPRWPPWSRGSSRCSSRGSGPPWPGCRGPGCGRKCCRAGSPGQSSWSHRSEPPCCPAHRHWGSSLV